MKVATTNGCAMQMLFSDFVVCQQILVPGERAFCERDNPSSGPTAEDRNTCK